MEVQVAVAAASLFAWSIGWVAILRSETTGPPFWASPVWSSSDVTPVD